MRFLKVLSLIYVFFIVGNSSAYAQSYLLNSSTNGSTITTCSGTFYDSGGAGSNYSNGQAYQITFCSDNGTPIEIDFTSWDVENQANCYYDELFIFDGTSNSDPLIGSYCTNSPGTVTATNTCLYFIFYSDSSVTESGWAASISCGTSAVEICGNGQDDDGDTDVDCDDSDCDCCELDPGIIETPTVVCPGDPGIINSLENPSFCNIVENPHFDDGTSDWSIWSNTGSSAAISIDNNSILSGENSLFVDVSAASGTNWHIELSQAPVTIYDGINYDFSFEAVAASPRTILVQIQLRESPWNAWWTQTINLTTTPQTFSFTNINLGADSDNAGVMFKFGTNTVDAWIDNISFESTACVEPTFEYQWQIRQDNGSGWTTWANISGATSLTYDPPTVSVLTEYRRVSNVQGCGNSETSNVVQADPCPCEADAGSDISICPGIGQALNASGTGNGTLSYAWSPSTGLSNTNTANPTANPSSNTTYTVTITDIDGCSATDQVLVTVYPNLSLTPADEDICLGGTSNVVPTASGAMPINFSWSGTNTGNNLTVSPAVTTNYTVTATDNNGCIAIEEITITVLNLPYVEFNPSNDVFCILDGSTLLDGFSPTGGSFTGAGITGDNFNPSTAGVGDHLITYAYTDSNGCDNSATTTLTVEAAPNITNLVPNDAHCGQSDGSITISFSNIAGVNNLLFSLDNGSSYEDPVADNSTSITYDNLASGIYHLWVKKENDLCVIDLGEITIADLSGPTVSISGTDSFCIGQSSTLMSTVTGATGTITYNWSGPNSFSASNQNPSVSQAGTYNLTVTDQNNCTATDDIVITTYSLPSVGLSLNNETICLNESSFVLSGGSPSGGIYSGNGVSSGSFDPSVAGVGTHAITYSFTDSNGCQNSRQENIEVYDLPSVSLTLNPIEACINEGTINLSGGSPPGGTYSGEGVSGNSIDLSIAGPGNHDIEYTVTDNNGCINTAVEQIEIYDIPTVQLTLNDDYTCLDGSIINLTGENPTGGIYSGTGVIGNSFDPTGLSIGDYTISYTYTLLDGCSDTATDLVTIHALPVVQLNMNTLEVCNNIEDHILTGGSPADGTYSGPGVTGISFDATGLIPGSHTISYTFIDVNGCSNIATEDIEVLALPNANLNLSNQDYCFGVDGITLSGASPAGGTYYINGVAGSIINTTQIGIGDHEVSYQVTGANGCVEEDSQTITVHDFPSVTLNLTDNLDCILDEAHALDGGSPTGGQFSGPGVIGNNFSASSAGPGTHIIVYSWTDTNGCSNTAEDQIIVEGIPNPSLNLDTDETCLSETTVSLTGGSPTGGSWSGPGVSGSNFDASLAGVGTHTIIYEFNVSGCTSSATDQIIVHSLPQPLLNLNLDESCLGPIDLNLSGGSPAGGIYSGPGVSGNLFNTTIAGEGAHTIIYTYTDSNGCSNTVTDIFTVHPNPVVTLNLPSDEICIDNVNYVLSGGSPAGGSYTGNGVTNGIFDASTAGYGVHTITYTFTDLNGCTNTASQNITVVNIPQATLDILDDEVCINDSNYSIKGGYPLGGIYEGPGISDTESGHIDLSALTPGVYTITYSYSVNGCTTQATDTFEVFALPAVSLNLVEDDQCYGAEAISLSGGSPAGGNYSGPGVSQNNFNSLFAGEGSHTITYTYQDINGCINTATDQITVHSLPSANLTLGETVFCVNEGIQVLSGGTPTGGTYSGPGVTGSNFNPAIAGNGDHTITYTYIDSNGCEAQAIDEIEVFLAPDVSYTSEDAFCELSNGSITFNFSNQSGVSYIQFSLNGGTTWKTAVADNSGSVSYQNLAAGSYEVLVRNGDETCVTMVATIVINNAGSPTAFAGPDITIASGQNTQLAGSGGNFYSWSPSFGLNLTNVADPIASPTQTTTYILTVTDTNGCTDTDEVTVEVIAQCLGTISSFPYYESFESGMGIWGQTGGDDSDWTRTNGATPSSSTGPSSASDGSYYMFVEASSNTNSTAILNGPCYDLADHSCAQLSFDYHMYGVNMGSLELQTTTTNGLIWSTIWSDSGNNGNNWQSQIVDLFGYLEENVQIRFLATTGDGSKSDMAIDNIEFITTGCGCDDTSSPFVDFSLLPDPMPFSIDIDDDGDADLLVGADGQLFYFRNNGNGTYTDITNTASDPLPNLSWLDMTLGFADLDNDGDYDMSVVGNEPGNHNFYWNTGSASNPIFTLAGTGGTPSSPIAGFDYNALDGSYLVGYADITIFFVDLDNDDDYDAVLGGKLGWFHYYENIGDETSPNFTRRTGADNPFNGFRADGEDEGNGIIQYESSPFLVDWDGDGDYDMFSGNQVATIQYFENIGTPTNPVFVERTGVNNPLDEVIFSEDTHISVIDEDCDGDWDIFYGVGDSAADAEITLCDLLVATPNGAIASSNQSHYCVGETVFLNEDGTTAINWNWSGPNGFSSNLENPTISNIDFAGAGTYTVTATSPQGCDYVDLVSFTVSSSSAEAGENQSIELGESVDLDGSGAGIVYLWTPSAGLSATNVLNPTASPATTTTYTLTVIDAFGCASTDQVTIFVETEECVEELTIFTADFENTNGDNSWSLGTAASDGDFVIGVPTPYTQSSITVMEIGAANGNQDLLTGNNSGQDLDGGPASATSPNINLSADADDIELTFFWYFSHYTNGGPEDYYKVELRSAANNAVLSTLISGNGAATDRDAEWALQISDLTAFAGQTVYLYVEASDAGSGGKVEFALDDFIIDEIFTVVASLDLTIDVSCEGNEAFVLSGGTPAGGTYSGPGVTGDVFDPNEAGPGVHTITYQYESPDGCIATSADDMTVDPSPEIELDLAENIACENQTIIGLFGGIPTGGTYTGTAVLDGEFDPSLAGPGVHTISYEVTDANGCMATATDDITVFEAPDNVEASTTNSTCGSDNGSITITFDDSPNITNLIFSLDGGITWEDPVLDDSGSVTYSDLSPQSYDLWLQEDTGVCTIIIPDLLIEDLDGPEINAGLDQFVCAGGTIDITPEVFFGNEPFTYLWSGPNDFSEATRDITVSDGGNYIITVTDTYGCSSTDDILINTFNINLDIQITNIECFGDTKGQIIANGSGGNSPYNYALSGEGSNGSGIFNNLAAGNYMLTLTDQLGCVEIQPITLEGPNQMVCVQDSCIRNTATAWTGNGPWTSTLVDATVSLSLSHDSNTGINSSSTSESLSNNGWFTDAANGADAISLEFVWDDSPEATNDSAQDDAGTASLTISFSDPIDCPVIHIDKLGSSILGQASNSTRLTLSSAGTLQKLSGTKDLIVSGNEIYKIPNILATASNEEAEDNSYESTAAGSIQILTAGPVTSITFELTGIGIEGSGSDLFEMAITGTKCFDVAATDYFCNDAGGTAGIFVCGGIGPYTFAWDHGQTTAFATDLMPGTHTVTITDAKGCTQICSVDIEGESLELDAGGNKGFCEGESNIFTPSIVNGSEPLVFAWSGPGNFASSDQNPQITEAGIYTLTVTDDNGCSAIDEVEAYSYACNETSPCHFLHEFNNLSYYGSDGTENWASEGWDETGDNNSAASGDIEIVGNALKMDHDDNSAPSISRRVDLSGHTSAILSFDFWGEGALSANDVFTVEVFDGTDWNTVFTYIAPIAGTQTPWLDISAFIDANTEIKFSIYSGFDGTNEHLFLDNIRVDVDCLCEGIADAGLDVTICESDTTSLAGSGGVSFLWTPSDSLSNASILNPEAFPIVTTTYELMVTDGNGCTDTDEVVVTVLDAPVGNLDAVMDDLCQTEDGSVTLTLSEGTVPYSVSWSNGDGSDTGSTTSSTPGEVIIENLIGGNTYCISITDANGCHIE